MRIQLLTFLLIVVPEFGYAASSVAGGAHATNIGKPGGGVLTGAGIGIGQVEGMRPGKSIANGGPDDDVNSVPNVNPAAVYMGTSTANTNGFRVINPITGRSHSTRVASLMISTDDDVPGVAPGALLHAGGYAVTSTTQRDAALTANHIARRNGGEIHAINMSFGLPLDGNENLSGNAHLTQFIDWSAREHDVLYVISGREQLGGAGPVPTTNYNGITVAGSAKDSGSASWSSAWSGNNYDEDASTNERVSVDLIAPGSLVDVVTVGGDEEDAIESGTSFAAPHVTAAVALLQEYAVAQQNLSTPGWGVDNPRRHEVMKAVLLNSAEKFTGVHGAGETHFTNNSQTWDQTVAHNDSDTPLDISFGAGHLNVRSAVTNYSSGEQGPGNVPLIGWDYGSVGSGFVDYVLEEPIGEESWVAVTMAWDREVEMTGFGSNYTSSSDFFDQPINMELENLNLYFMPASSNNINDAIFSSTATGDSVEHIFRQLSPQQAGEYKIRVLNAGGPNGFADFGLAWWTGGGEFDFPADFDSDGDVDGDDLSQWQGDFGLNGDSDADNDNDSDGADFLAWQQGSAGSQQAQGGSGGSGQFAGGGTNRQSGGGQQNVGGGSVALEFTSRAVTQAEINDSSGGPDADDLVHEFLVDADADILSVGEVEITTTDSGLFQHSYGSDTEGPHPALVAYYPGLGADSFITTPGSTATAGGGFGDVDVSWFDTGNDGAQQDFIFAQLTTEGGTFSGILTIRGANGPESFPFSFVFGNAASAVAVPEPSCWLLVLSLAPVVGWPRDRRAAT